MGNDPEIEFVSEQPWIKYALISLIAIEFITLMASLIWLS